MNKQIENPEEVENTSSEDKQNQKDKKSKLEVFYTTTQMSMDLVVRGFKDFSWNEIIEKYKYFIISIFLVFIFIIYTLVAKINIISPGNGVITGGDDQIQVISPTSGFINEFNLSSGEHVKIDQELFSFTNLDNFYQEKLLKEVIEANSQELNKIQLDLKLLATLNKGVGIDRVNQLVEKHASISTQATKLKNQENIVPVEKSIVDDNAISSIDVNVDNNEIETLLKENTNRVDLNYYKFKIEYDSLKDEANNFSIRTNLFEQEKKSYEYQLSVYVRKADLLKLSKSPEVDVLENNANISRTRLSLISAENMYISLAEKLKVSERDFFSRLYQKMQDLNERLISLKKDNLEKQGQLALIKQKLYISSVKSPINGTILKIEKTLTKGSFIEANQIILTIKKESEEAIVRSRFEAKYRPFIHVGGTVEIVIDSPGYKRTMVGTIVKISDDSFARDPSNAKGSVGSEQRYYSVDIKPNNASEFKGLYEGIEARVYAQSTSINIFTYITALFNKGPIFNVW